MNQVLLVSYDLVNPGQNYESLLKLLKEYPQWARLGGSSYLIGTPATPEQVRDKLITVLDSNDKLFVTKVVPPSAWFGLPEEVSNWIHSNLK